MTVIPNPSIRRALCTGFRSLSRAILRICTSACKTATHREGEMRYLKTSEAAQLLNVSPNTLRAWERRFDFPKPQRSPGKHRLFTHGEIAALRDALQEGLSISSAVSRAREGLSSDANSLVGALSSFERERADTAIEASLALRSVERTVTEIMMPTLDEIHGRHGGESAVWAFAAHWSADWLRRAIRLAPIPSRPFAVLIGDATRDELDPDGPRVRALELLCARSGIDVLTLSARGVAGIGEAVAIIDPTSSSSPGATSATTGWPAGPTRPDWPPQRSRRPSTAAATGGPGDARTAPEPLRWIRRRRPGR
jgi:DNA-binding transcriptional MerR regulator